MRKEEEEEEVILKRKSVDAYFKGMKDGKEIFTTEKSEARRFTDIDKCTKMSRELKAKCSIEHLLGE